MPIDPDKYIVFKRREFLELLQDGASYVDYIHIALPDSVVLRLKDVHAAGALYCYAMSLLATHEILTQAIGVRNDDRAHEVSYLKTMKDIWDIHEYFLTLAEEARRNGADSPTP